MRGIHNLSGPKRLVDVISLAGGVKPDAGSRGHRDPGTEERQDPYLERSI